MHSQTLFGRNTAIETIAGYQSSKLIFSETKRKISLRRCFLITPKQLLKSSIRLSTTAPTTSYAANIEIVYACFDDVAAITFAYNYSSLSTNPHETTVSLPYDTNSISIFIIGRLADKTMPHTHPQSSSFSCSRELYPRLQYFESADPFLNVSSMRLLVIFCISA